MSTPFRLVAFKGGSVVARHDVTSSIKNEIKEFKKQVIEKFGASIDSGIMLYDVKKEDYLDFGILTDADGDEYVKIGR